MQKKYCYEYPRPALTVDAVIFKRKQKGILEVLLIERKNDPFKGFWAFPGGFVNIDEDLETAVKRELFEETGLKDVELQQLYTFGAVNRDPRGRTVSVVYWGIAGKETEIFAGDDASKASWFPVDNLPRLAFDHDEIMKKALEKLKI